MGIVADTSVFTLCERRRWTAKQVAQHLNDLFSNEQIVIPSIVAAELVHGIYRAKTQAQSTQRRAYVEPVLSSYLSAAFTEDVAWIAGRVRAEQTAMGNMLPIAGSFIAATALALNFSILTHNLKDFTRIPGLQVIPFVLP